MVESELPTLVGSDPSLRPTPNTQELFRIPRCSGAYYPTIWVSLSGDHGQTGRGFRGFGHTDSAPWFQPTPPEVLAVWAGAMLNFLEFRHYEVQSAPSAPS